MLVLTVAEGRITVPSEGSRVLYRTNVTIGRHEINDWVLPDPDRYLSGRHCVITYRDGEYWITDTSTIPSTRLCRTVCVVTLIRSVRS